MQIKENTNNILSEKFKKTLLISTGAFGVAVLANYVGNKMENPNKNDGYFAILGGVLGIGLSIYLINEFDKDFANTGKTDIKKTILIGSNTI